MKIIQRKTCGGCKALIESPDKLISLVMDANIVIFTCSSDTKWIEVWQFQSNLARSQNQIKRF